MTFKKLLLACCLALVLAACGGEAADTTTSAPADTTATTAAEAPVTTSADTTTTGGDTTTTTASSGTSSDLAALQAAMRTSADAAPARVEGVMRMEGVTGGEGPEVIEMPFEMMMDAATGNSSMVMDFAAMAQMGGSEEMPPEMADMMGSMEVRQIGDTVYLKFPFFTAFMGAETEWVSMPAEEGGDVTEGLGGSTAPSDPSTFLESFSEVEGTAEEVGPEDVRGISTTHYRIVIDQDWREQLPADELAELEEQGALPEADFPLDLWIDGDGLVQRMAMTMTGEELGEDEFQGMTMTFDFFDFGQPVTIEPPPADQVTDMEEMGGPFGGMTTPTTTP